MEQQVQENRGSQKWRGLGVSAAHEEPERHLAIVPFDHPEYENHDHLTVEMIEGLLRDKICSATRTDVVLKRETWLAFTRAGGSDRKGLKLPQMRTRLQQWGIRPNEKVTKEAFAKWDVDGSGAIDFDETRGVKRTYRRSSTTNTTVCCRRRRAILVVGNFVYNGLARAKLHGAETASG